MESDCGGCRGAATIKDLDEMYARILVKIEQVMDRIERLQNQVDMLMRHTYPTPYKKYQD